MDDEQPPTPSFRVLRQTNPCEVVYDHLHGSIGGWRSRRTNSYEMVDECEPTSCFLFTPHHPPFLLPTSRLSTYSFPIYSLLLLSLPLTPFPFTPYSSPPYYLLLLSLLLLLLAFDVHFLSFCIPIS